MVVWNNWKQNIVLKSVMPWVMIVYIMMTILDQFIIIDQGTTV